VVSRGGDEGMVNDVVRMKIELDGPCVASPPIRVLMVWMIAFPTSAPRLLRSGLAQATQRWLAAFKSKKGVVDEFHAESDTIQILAKVAYPIAGDSRSARPGKCPSVEQTAVTRAHHFWFHDRILSRGSGYIGLAIIR
jgi:hypothetical protein